MGRLFRADQAWASGCAIFSFQTAAVSWGFLILDSLSKLERQQKRLERGDDIHWPSITYSSFRSLANFILPRPSSSNPFILPLTKSPLLFQQHLDKSFTVGTKLFQIFKKLASSTQRYKCTDWWILKHIYKRWFIKAFNYLHNIFHRELILFFDHAV